MKAPLFGFFVALAATFSVLSAADLSDSERFARLSSAPITLYPEVALKESPLVAVFNANARSDDAIVTSYVDSLKTNAKMSDLGVKRGEIWLYVPRDLDLTQNGRQHIEGAQGILFVPSDSAPLEGSLSNEARYLAERARTLGFRLAAGLEPKTARTLAHVGDVAKHAAVFTIYDAQKLRSPAKYRAYVERLVKEAKAVNPDVKIEIAISTGANERASKELAGILWNCADLIDRIGIYCNNSAESQSSLALYYKVLRAGS